MPRTYKALSLLSGGLDSQLAVCVLQEQGIHVEGITYSSPFFGPEKGTEAAKALGIKQHIIDFTEEILEQVQRPAHGLGGAMNPCIDCHAQMIRRAGEFMEAEGFDFIATGEVLAQRPMSQNKQSLGVVARCSKYEDLLIRPLSAPLLPPTKPIREGWLDLEKLPRFSGRNRTPQIELAAHFGLKDYPAPAGGCLLTEERFGYKLKDLLDHEGLDEDRTNVWLLQTGRHMRLADNVKIVVGSCKEDNLILRDQKLDRMFRIFCPEQPGPVTLVPAYLGEEQLELACAITARYAKKMKEGPVRTRIVSKDGERDLLVQPLSPEKTQEYFIA